MAYGWEGDKVRLVPLDKNRHLENALLWFNDPTVTAWLETGDWPLTRGTEEEFFRAAERPDKGSVQFAIETHDGDHVGFSGLRSIDWQSRVAVSGSVIGRSDLWGRRTRHRLGSGAVALRLRGPRSAHAHRHRDCRQRALHEDARGGRLPRSRPRPRPLLEARRMAGSGDSRARESCGVTDRRLEACATIASSPAPGHGIGAPL